MHLPPFTYIRLSALERIRSLSYIAQFNCSASGTADPIGAHTLPFPPCFAQSRSQSSRFCLADPGALASASYIFRRWQGFRRTLQINRALNQGTHHILDLRAISLQFASTASITNTVPYLVVCVGLRAHV